MNTQPVVAIWAENEPQTVEAEVRAGGLWLDPPSLERVSGWEPKPEGMCRGTQCFPIPHDREAEFVSGERYNLAALAGLVGQPVVADSEHRVWCFGAASSQRGWSLRSLEAPDFTLPDIEGRMHSLSQHRGRKVLLVSWASW